MLLDGVVYKYFTVHTDCFKNKLCYTYRYLCILLNLLILQHDTLLLKAWL